MENIDESTQKLITIIKTQTTYTDSESYELLQKFNNNPIKVIEYC